MKKCPFCAEEIQDDAIKCRHCNEFIKEVVVKAKTPWYAKGATVVLSFLTVGPFALPLVWFHPVYSLRKKIIITVIVLALTWYAADLLIRSAKTILDFYKEAGIF